LLVFDDRVIFIFSILVLGCFTRKKGFDSMRLRLPVNHIDKIGDDNNLIYSLDVDSLTNTISNSK